MELQINHPETCSYVVGDAMIHGHKSEDLRHIDIFIKPRDDSETINLTISEENWLKFIAETSKVLTDLNY